MRNCVKFNVDFLKDGLYGFEGCTCPVDKVAELVLSSTNNPITKVTITYDDGTNVEYKVADIIDQRSK
jgi:hypothetical protein